jgi:hypothetical protein
LLRKININDWQNIPQFVAKFHRGDAALKNNIPITDLISQKLHSL